MKEKLITLKRDKFRNSIKIKEKRVDRKSVLDNLG